MSTSHLPPAVLDREVCRFQVERDDCARFGTSKRRLCSQLIREETRIRNERRRDRVAAVDGGSACDLRGHSPPSFVEARSSQAFAPPPTAPRQPACRFRIFGFEEERRSGTNLVSIAWRLWMAARHVTCAVIRGRASSRRAAHKPLRRHPQPRASQQHRRTRKKSAGFKSALRGHAGSGSSRAHCC
jgi:hypothetical protein